MSNKEELEKLNEYFIGKATKISIVSPIISHMLKNPENVSEESIKVLKACKDSIEEVHKYFKVNYGEK